MIVTTAEWNNLLRRIQRLEHYATVELPNTIARRDDRLDDIEDCYDEALALGGFFGRAIAHQADVTDHRRAISPEYLIRIAHDLFTSRKLPGASLPA